MNKCFQKVDGFEAPHPSNIIWRYMSLEKFLDMLERKTLRFARASTMSDKRELLLPYEKLEARHWQRPRGLSKEDLWSDSDKHWEKLDYVRKKADDLRQRICLSSWAIAQTESYALWKIYLGGSRAGVAIKSTFSALQKAILPDQNHTIQHARVRYTDDVNPEHLEERHFIFQKSTHYEYEKELRLAVDYHLDPSKSDRPIIGMLAEGSNSSPDALHIPIDTNTLIREVYLSPFNMRGFRKTFESIVRKIDPKLKAPIKASAVRDS